MPKLFKKKLFTLAKLFLVLLALPLIVFLFQPKLISQTKAQDNNFYVATNGDDSNPGTIDQPWRTIGKANAMLEAGDTVYIRTGTYQETIRPARSGTEGNIITYSAYPGETVTILHNGIDEAVVVPKSRGYLVIDGFTIDANEQARWIDAWNNNGHITIQNNTMRNPKRDEHGIILSQGTHWKILNNKLYHGSPGSTTGTDAIKLVEGSDYALIEGNHIENSQHAGVFVFASHVVVRNNYFKNVYNQAAESAGGGIGNGHILWEHNTFTTPAFGIDPKPSEGLQLWSINNIVRHNLFYDCYGGGVSPTAWDNPQANVTTDNRFYNNIFYNNRMGGVWLVTWADGVDVSDNVFKNNAFYQNYKGFSNYSYQEISPLPVQFWIQDVGGTKLISSNYFWNNSLWYQNPGDAVIGHVSLGNHPLSWWQTNYPSNFANNIEVNPGFVDENNYDFHLRSDSPLIEAGTFLTRVANSGSGTSLPVEDAFYFSDGFGIVEADWIKIGNQEPVQISSVNYDTQTITLTQSRSWNNSDPVYLYKDSSGNVVLSGSAPDIGAYEYTGGAQPTATPTPQQPTPTPTPILPSPTPYQHCLPLGDIDCSGKVNSLDFSYLIAYYNTSDPRADLDDSSQVNALDVSRLLVNFGQTNP